jgi:hypothetical protein
MNAAPFPIVSSCYSLALSTYREQELKCWCPKTGECTDPDSSSTGEEDWTSSEEESSEEEEDEDAESGSV